MLIAKYYQVYIMSHYKLVLFKNREHLDLLGLRVSWEVQDSMVFLAPEVTVVFLVAPVLL